METTEDKTYNGWTNYETWNVALWLDNDQGTYSLMHEMAREHKDEAHNHHNVPDIWNEEQAARFELSDSIKGFVEERNPLAEDASMFTDLLGAALSEVNWDEIASHYLEEN